MEHYVGLDVSLKLTAICIVNRTGKIEREGVVSSDLRRSRYSSNRMRRMSRGLGSNRSNRDLALDGAEEAGIARHLHRCEARQGCFEDADQQE